MANNQDDLLSDIDLSSLAQVWSMLNPVNRLQQEMGEDAPDILGGPGLLADAATGPVGGLRGLGSLLKKFTHEAGSGGLMGVARRPISAAKKGVSKWVENDRQRAKRFQESEVMKAFEKILKKNTKSSGLTWGDNTDLANRVQVASDQLLVKLKKQGFFEFMAKRKRDDLRISEEDIKGLISYYFRN